MQAEGVLKWQDGSGRHCRRCRAVCTKALAAVCRASVCSMRVLRRKQEFPKSILGVREGEGAWSQHTGHHFSLPICPSFIAIKLCSSNPPQGDGKAGQAEKQSKNRQDEGNTKSQYALSTWGRGGQLNWRVSCRLEHRADPTPPWSAEGDVWVCLAEAS